MPIFLREIICQEQAIGRLQMTYASDKIANTWIFAGPEGVGKYTTAAAWAKLLLCSRPVSEDTAAGRRHESCGSCESCRLMDAGTHPDYTHVYKELVEYTRDGKGKQPPSLFPIDVIREFLLEKAAGSSTVSNCRVFVVSEAEKLTIQAQNALLKLLEEPPLDCYIILLCTRLDRLLPTTLSRCQIARFGSVEESCIIESLGKKGIAADEAGFWARYSGGSLGVSLRWAGLRPGNTSAWMIKRQLVSALALLKTDDTLDLAERLTANVKLLADHWHEQEPQISRTDISRTVEKGVIYVISTAMSDAMKVAGQMDLSLVHADQAAEIAAIARRMGVERSAELVGSTYRSVSWAESNVNTRLVFEDLLLDIAGCGII